MPVEHDRYTAAAAQALDGVGKKGSLGLGAKLRNGGVRQTRFVSDSLLTALNGVPPGAVAEKPLLLKAFVVGAAGYPFEFETIVAS